jgi:hypothetical protein
MRFVADANVKQAVISWLQILDTFFCAGAQTLLPRGTDASRLHGDLMGSSASQVSRIHRSLNKALSVRVFVNLLLKLFYFPLENLCFFVQVKGRMVTRKEKN